MFRLVQKLEQRTNRERNVDRSPIRRRYPQRHPRKRMARTNQKLSTIRLKHRPRCPKPKANQHRHRLHRKKRPRRQQEELPSVDYNKLFPAWCYTQLALDLFGSCPSPKISCCPTNMRQHEQVITSMIRHPQLEPKMLSWMCEYRGLHSRSGCILRQALHHYLEQGVGAPTKSAWSKWKDLTATAHSKLKTQAHSPTTTDLVY